jgi:hypothetical protein
MLHCTLGDTFVFDAVGASLELPDIYCLPQSRRHVLGVASAIMVPHPSLMLLPINF